MIYNTDNLSFQILSINVCTHENGFFSVKGRPYSSVSLRISGSGNFCVGETSFTNHIGQIMYIPKNMDYTVDYRSGESIVLHLIDCNYTIPENFSVHNENYVKSSFMAILNRWNASHNQNRVKADFYHLLADISEEKSKKFDREFRKSISYIRENFLNPDFNILDICQFVNISQSTLYRHFISYYGISPKQYLLNQRLTHAVDLLIRQNLSVKTVAYSSGFSDEKYFARIFKKYYGDTPSHFRKSDKSYQT